MSAAARIATGQHLRFAAWALVGAGACLAVLGAMTIGMFVLPLVGAVALVLALRTPVDRSLLGGISGLSIPLFYVAWLNREGPGFVCHGNGHFSECAERWTPWPWFVLGIVLLVAGIATFHRFSGDRSELSRR